MTNPLLLAETVGSSSHGDPLREDENPIGIAMMQILTAPEAVDGAGHEVWANCRASADLVLFPAAYFSGAGGCAAVAAEQGEVSRNASVAIASTCGGSGIMLTDARGRRVPLLTHAGTGGTDSGAHVVQTATLAVGAAEQTLTLGFVVGYPALWSPLAPRLAMLHGAELIVAPVAWTPDDEGWDSDEEAIVEDAMLLSRGFENAAAVARVNYGRGARGGFGGRSALASWCNGWILDGCEGDEGGLMVLADAEPGVVFANFSLSDLRSQRKNGIWGDGFRRPYAYAELCGFLSAPPKAAECATEEGKFEVTVAMLQLEPPATKAASLLSLEAAVRRAAAGGADVALAPEMWSTGYEVQFPESAGNAGLTTTVADLRAVFAWAGEGSSETLDGPYISHLRELAKEVNIAIAVGMMRRGADDGPLVPPTNSVVLIDRHGTIRYAYDKVHTCRWIAPGALLQPGREFFTAALETKSGQSVVVGSIICADREFPEASRTLAAMRGAELMLTPNACTLKPQQLRQFRTRAAENVMGVAMTNYAGPAYLGKSVAFDHRGRTLSAPAAIEEEVIFATFDIGALRRARKEEAARDHGGLLDQAPVPTLCQLQRRPEFARQNVFGRV